MAKFSKDSGSEKSVSHDALCPCSEVPDGRYCYLINEKTGCCIDCECGQHEVPQKANHPDPYVRNWVISTKSDLAHDDYIRKAIKPYLQYALLYGYDAAVRRMYTDHMVKKSRSLDANK